MEAHFEHSTESKVTPTEYNILKLVEFVQCHNSVTFRAQSLNMISVLQANSNLPSGQVSSRGHLTMPHIVFWERGPHANLFGPI